MLCCIISIPRAKSFVRVSKVRDLRPLVVIVNASLTQEVIIDVSGGPLNVMIEVVSLTEAFVVRG